jgi:ribosomal protein L21E
MECQCSTGVDKELKDPAMMVFVSEEAKARTVKIKPKHIKSNWYHQV